MEQPDIIDQVNITHEAAAAWREAVEIAIRSAASARVGQPTNIEDERAEMLPDGSLRIYARIQFGVGSLQAEIKLPPAAWRFKAEQ